MANKQIDMRKAKQIFKLYSKRRISGQLGISRNTVIKYIDFFKRYRLTPYEVSEMTLEEIHSLCKISRRPKNEKLKTLEGYFHHFDRELRRTGVTRQLLWKEYHTGHPDGFKLSQFRYWYRGWTKETSPVMHFTHKAGNKLLTLCPIKYSKSTAHRIDIKG